MQSYLDLQREIVSALEYGAPSQSADVSVVPMQLDYERHPDRTLTTVMFIEKEIGQAIQEALIEPLSRVEPEHHYYSSDALHITIKNIRSLANPPTFTETDIENADRILRSTIPKHQAFNLMLEETVAFRNSVTVIGFTDQRLKQLIQDLDRRLRKADLPDDKRYASNCVFFSNITLCRFVHQPSDAFLQAVSGLRHEFHRLLKVRQLHLVVANPVCTAATRRIINSYDLG